MNSLKVSVRRAGSVFAALALVLTTALPGIASAAQLTERSIQIGSSTAGATGVGYEIKFTAKADAGAVVIDFCSNSPLVGGACTAPTGFDIAGATVSGGFTKDAVDTTANTLVVTGTIDADTAGGVVTIPVAGVDNPTDPGTLYARIMTYEATEDTENYTSTTPGDVIDEGGVALYITPTVEISAAVLESMTFCVSASNITAAGCTDATPPILELGETSGSVKALSPEAISSGNLYTQISTNALNGAVVRLKSDQTGCGGLSRIGAASFAAGCGIAPAGATDILAGQAKFGLKLGTAAGATGEDVPSSGTIRPYDGGSGAYYDTSTFKLNYVDSSTGVTGTYGDPLLDTDGAPVNNMVMPITFGASASNSTTAGNYRANLSLIATGTF